MNRRDFLRRLGVTTAAAGLLPALSRAANGIPSQPRDDKSINDAISKTADGKLPTRPLGRLGINAGILGFGGGFIFQTARQEAVNVVRAFVDGGGNYIDTAAQYGGGQSEEIIGEALEGERRQKVYLATKILQRSHSSASKEFAASLKRLRVDSVDLLQVHAVNSESDFEAVFGKDGSLQVALEAKRTGKARYIGITGHTRPSIILKALEEQDFDSVLVPVGLGDTTSGDFSEAVLPVARKKGLATIGMKLLGMKSYVGDIGVPLCLRYSLNLPIDVGIVGLVSKDEVSQAMAVANDLKPVDEKELAAAIEKASAIRSGGALWWKKT